MMDVQTGRLWRREGNNWNRGSKRAKSIHSVKPGPIMQAAPENPDTPFTRLGEAGSPKAPAPYSPQWMWIGDRGKSKDPSPAGCGQVLHGRALKRAE